MKSIGGAIPPFSFLGGCFMEEMELNHLIAYVEEIKKRRGFDHTTPPEEFLLFSEEVGELAYEINKLYRKGTGGDVKALAFEVVDCLIYLLSIAGMFGIHDLEKYFREKEDLNTKRFG